MKKTVTAEEFRKAPQKVYEEAVKGEVKINHLHYRDRIFTLTSRQRREDNAKTTD